ncbi:MAG: hypothetical protein H7Z42_06280 [Roseiflexaceae bacterium]|nr:hypothetical protein [Roseiflexaceae bacterium]
MNFSLDQVSFVLGVDAGNTKTIALVADRAGRIRGAGRGGCGDIYRSPAAAFAEIERAVGDALATAGLRADQLEVGAFSMAGADWPEDFALIHEHLRERGLGRQQIVVNDALGALRAGAPNGPAVAVVCGTGIATGARAGDGQTWHSSFWQEVNGAEYLGREVLRVVVRAELGIDPPTTLTQRTLDVCGLPSVEALVYQQSARNASGLHYVKHLARVLLDEALAGDSLARALVIQNGQALGDYALAAARKVGILTEPFALVFAGGVLRHPCPLLADTITACVQAHAPGAIPMQSRFEPAVGAVFLAFDHLNWPVDSAVHRQIASTVPSTELFAT